jgi:hypothetical protein
VSSERDVKADKEAIWYILAGAADKEADDMTRSPGHIIAVEANVEANKEAEKHILAGAADKEADGMALTDHGQQGLGNIIASEVDEGADNLVKAWLNERIVADEA